MAVDAQRQTNSANGGGDPVPHRSWLEDFTWGALMALVIVVAVFIGWSVIAPPAPVPPATPVGENEGVTGGAGAPEAPAQDPSQAPAAETPPPTPASPDPSPAETDGQSPATPAPPEPDQEPPAPTEPAAPPEPQTPVEPELPEGPDAPVQDQPAPPPETPEPIDLNAPPNDTDPPLEAPSLSLAGPAYEVNARPFSADPDAPLLAIVLTGAAPGSVSPEQLVLAGVPLTFSVPPGGEAAQVAGMMRDAGHEVLLETVAVSGAALSDPEAMRLAILSDLAELPMAFGVTTPSDQPLVSEGRVLDAAFETLAEHGHAFVDLRGRIGTVTQSLARANTVPFASGDRFAAPDASAARIVQVIGGAAFQARREGSAIVAVAASEA
ncbi:MAG: divergent polysaccharide deacetylase family protein, partial [Pseudomonadota bacterium]